MMVPVIVLVSIRALVLLSCTSAVASSSTSRSVVATPTVPPNATGIFCPLFNTHYVSPPNSLVCGVKGRLTKPSILSTLCDNEECYFQCARDPLCVAFGYDTFQGHCINYGKSLASMEFQLANDSDISYYEIRSCWQCTEPTMLPKRKYCPTTSPVRLQPPLKNYTCGTFGNFEDNQDVGGQPGISFEECYAMCAGLDQRGGCSSFRFSPEGGRFVTECKLFLRSLYQKGFMASNNSYQQGWSLRGCFECNLQERPGSNCVPTSKTHTPTPTPTFHAIAKNGDFSQTILSPTYNQTQPRFWHAENNTRAIKGPNGNTYTELYADSRNGRNIDSCSTSMRQTVSGFNDGIAGNMYNLTFDMAFTQYYKPKAAKQGCNIYFPLFHLVFLSNWTVSPSWFTVGPGLVDMTSAALLDYFTLSCQEYDEITGENIAGNATILIDNVKWTQNDRVAGDS